MRVAWLYFSSFSTLAKTFNVSFVQCFFASTSVGRGTAAFIWFTPHSRLSYSESMDWRYGGV